MFFEGKSYQLRHHITSKLLFIQEYFKRNTIFCATFSWEQRKLREIVTPYRLEIPTPRTSYQRLGIRSHAKGTFHEDVAPGQGLEAETMFVVKPNNLIVNITFAWEQALAITGKSDDGKLVSHRFPQFSFNPGYDFNYFRFALLDKRFNYELDLASPGGAGRNRVLNISAFLNIWRIVPSFDEQKRIGTLFSGISQAIVLHQRMFFRGFVL